MKKLKIDDIESFLLGKYEIRINIITNTIEKRTKGGNDPFMPVNESDLKYALFKAGYSRFDGEMKAILGSSIIPKYDPFKEYFEGLEKWDTSQPDYIHQLTTFVKTDDQKWFEIMFKKMLVRTVAQSLGLPQFNKHCFTLVGKQHDGKTYFLDYLVPDSLNCYYKKGYDFHGGRQSKFSLVQNFIVNLDELAQFDKKDLNNEFKATLSESTVKYAPLFSSTEVSFSRRASFVASTNQYEFLTDETGSVRWIIFNILSINHDKGGSEGYNQVDINKVWAQAYNLLKDGFKCELTSDEINQTELVNRRFIRVTPEMELMTRFFKSSSKGSDESAFHTATTLEKFFREKGFPKVTHIQIGKALKMLGFQQEQKYNSQLRYQEKGYYLQEIDF